LRNSGGKRLAFVVKERVVGIVSRANLVQAHLREEDRSGTTSGSMIRKKVMMGLKSERWSKHALLSATGEDGTVKSWGIVDSEAEKEARRVAAEQVAGVRAIENNVIVQPAVGGA
ncbi:MAG: BON domain-containing protein, partial [Pseudolabrys sp.]